MEVRVNTEEKVAETEVATQEAQPTAQQELATLKAELQAREADLKKWQEEAKTHQSNFTKTQQRLKEAESFRQEIQDVKDDIKVLADFVVKTRSGDDVLGDEPKKSSLSLDAERLRRAQERAQALAIKADALATSTGLNMEDSPELQKALNLFLRGRAEAGFEEVERVVAERRQVAPAVTQGQPTEKKAELTEEQEAEIARKYLEKKGSLKTDTGAPSASGRSWKTVMDDFNEGKINLTQFEAEAQKRGIRL